jgi:hypothetical protein
MNIDLHEGVNPTILADLAPLQQLYIEFLSHNNYTIGSKKLKFAVAGTKNVNTLVADALYTRIGTENPEFLHTSILERFEQVQYKQVLDDPDIAHLLEGEIIPGDLPLDELEERVNDVADVNRVINVPFILLMLEVKKRIVRIRPYDFPKLQPRENPIIYTISDAYREHDDDKLIMLELYR